MKHKILLLQFIVLSVLLMSCQDDEPQVTVPPSNSLESSLSGSQFVLNQDNAADVFAQLQWTPVSFGTAAVKYSLEMDVAGNGFKGAIDMFTTQELSASLTVQKLNEALIRLGLEPGNARGVEMRIRSWVNFVTDPATSNSLSFTVTPYLLVFPPIYVIGDAQAWSLNNAVELVSYSPGVYEGEVKFQTNGKFRFFALPNWSSQQWGWGYFTGGTIPEQFGNGNDGDSNFRFTGQSGSYKITVSIPGKTIAIEPAGELPPPPPPSILFMVAAQAVTLEDGLELKRNEAGVYEGIVMLEKNMKFRFFADKQWNAEKWNFTSFAEGTVPAQLRSSGDDVANFLFTGESGYYKITVSIDDLVITLEPSDPPQQTLFIIGDAQGWNLNNALQMRSLGNNTFETIGTFQLNGKFRFFVAPDWSAKQYGWNSFSGGTIDSDLADGADGDSNFKFASANGIYKVTVSLGNKTITVVPADAPTLYIIGGDQGWNLNNAFQLTWLGGGKYQGTTTFTNNSIFRFFETPAWDAPQWRWSSFAGGTIDGDLQDGGGADSNFRFAGTTGTHTITVNLYNLTIQVE
jgi:hypothetical protein